MPASARQTLLYLNIFLYVLIVLASILLLIGIAIYNHWLLVPWMILMAIDIIRGFISVFFIFWFSYVCPPESLPTVFSFRVTWPVSPPVSSSSVSSSSTWVSPLPPIVRFRSPC